jgi:hypothetical protein
MCLNMTNSTLRRLGLPPPRNFRDLYRVLCQMSNDMLKYHPPMYFDTESLYYPSIKTHILYLRASSNRVSY